MTLRLQRNRSAGQHQIAILDQPFGILVAFVELWLVVFQDNFAIEQMLNHFVVMDFDLRCDPLFAVVGFRRRIDAMLQFQFAIHYDVRAWRAEIGSRAFVFAVSTQQLHFNRDRNFDRYER